MALASKERHNLAAQQVCRNGFNYTAGVSETAYHEIWKYFQSTSRAHAQVLQNFIVQQPMSMWFWLTSWKPVAPSDCMFWKEDTCRRAFDVAFCSAS